MKSQWAIVAAVLAVTFGVFGWAKADNTVDPSKKPTELPATHLTRHEIVEKLQLTDEQKKAIRDTRAAYRTSIAKLDGEIKLKKVELDNELDKPEPDQLKIDQVTQDLGVLYGQRINVRVKASVELEKKILTPQQADMLKSLQVKEGSASDEIL